MSDHSALLVSLDAESRRTSLESVTRQKLKDAAEAIRTLQAKRRDAVRKCEQICLPVINNPAAYDQYVYSALKGCAAAIRAAAQAEFKSASRTHNASMDSMYTEVRKLQAELAAEREAHAQLQSRCYD